MTETILDALAAVLAFCLLVQFKPLVTTGVRPDIRNVTR